jgi:hypothetical protein
LPGNVDIVSMMVENFKHGYIGEIFGETPVGAAVILSGKKTKAIGGNACARIRRVTAS